MNMTPTTRAQEITKMVNPQTVDNLDHEINRGMGNLLGEALSFLPEEEADDKLAHMEAGNARFYWEPGYVIVIEIDGDRFLEVHLYEALAASLWPAERERDPQPA
jgi:hypothetical protein